MDNPPPPSFTGAHGFDDVWSFDADEVESSAGSSALLAVGAGFFEPVLAGLFASGSAVPPQPAIQAAVSVEVSKADKRENPLRVASL